MKLYLDGRATSTRDLPAQPRTFAELGECLALLMMRDDWTVATWGTWQITRSQSLACFRARPWIFDPNMNDARPWASLLQIAR